MPIEKDILEQLAKNDPSLVHLDLSFPYDVFFSNELQTYIGSKEDQDRLTDNDIIVLNEALNHNTYLKSLNLNNNKIGVLGITLLARQGLEILSIQKNGLDSACVDALMMYDMLSSLNVSANMLADRDIAKLGTHARLSSLDVSKNVVGPLSLNAFGLNRTLTTLTINKTRYTSGIGRRGIIDLTPLKFNKTLKCLNIRDANITAFEALSETAELKTLNLENCFIGNNSAEDISYISSMPKLTHLSMRQPDFRWKDTDHIAELLADLPLEYLDMSKTRMSALGAKALARNKTLKTLIVSHNFIGIYGLIALAENKNITHLDISGNNFSRYDTSSDLIIERNIAELWGGETSVAAREIIRRQAQANVALMNALEQNTTLRRLNMSDMLNPQEHFITDERMESFIKNNTTIVTLDICHYAYEVQTPVLVALSKNKMLREISFSCNLENEENQNALAKNYSLTKITCKKRQKYSVGEATNQPYAQKIQERNKHLVMSFLFLHAMKPRNDHPVVIDNIDLLNYIGSFLFKPQWIMAAQLRAHSIFNGNMTQSILKRSLKRRQLEDLEDEFHVNSSVDDKKARDAGAGTLLFG